jgi:hypothetical protein
MAKVTTIKRIESTVIEKPQVVEPVPQLQPEAQTNEIHWNDKKQNVKVGTKTKCIVIDKYNRWHEDVMLDLKGRDTSEYSWCYYGTWFPVLVEQKDGLILPYIHTDAVGESSNRLWKAANPEGFKNTFKHTNSMMQKIQLGLMVAVVLGIFGLIFVLINQ